jgi:hypothetical protein
MSTSVESSAGRIDPLPRLVVDRTVVFLATLLLGGAGLVLAQEPTLAKRPKPAAAKNNIGSGPNKLDATRPDTATPAATTVGTSAATPASVPATGSTGDRAATATETTAEPPVETVRELYPNGRVMIELEVVRDAIGELRQHGNWRMWNAAGALIVRGECRDNLYAGKWQRLLRPGQVPLLSESPYRLYPGPFISQATFLEGQLHGPWTILDAQRTATLVVRGRADRGLRRMRTGTANWPLGLVPSQWQNRRERTLRTGPSQRGLDLVECGRRSNAHRTGRRITSEHGPAITGQPADNSKVDAINPA